MTSKEFVMWLKGFVAGSASYNLTPAGWHDLKDHLAQVSDEVLILSSPQPQPYDPYRVTCTDRSGTSTPGFAATTTPGATGFITINNPSSMMSFNPEEAERRMDIIGQNGNEGLHYSAEDLGGQWVTTTTNDKLENNG
jgi:hypothetical protein